MSVNVAETKKKWDDQGIGTNAVFLIGFGTVRNKIMGMEQRNATPEEEAEIDGLFVALKQILLLTYCIK